MWLGLVKVFIVLGLYGTAVEPRFVQRNDIVAVVPGLPASWNGKQIAVFADLQVGMWWANTDAVRKVVRSVDALKPAAVPIAGDFVYNADSTVDDQMRQVVDLLHPLLDDSMPIYAVLGNHDYSLMNEHSQKENYVAGHVRRALEAAGVHMMDNVVEALPSPGTPADTQPLYLAGIGERWAKNDHTLETMAKVPTGAPRLVFMHDPDDFADIPAGEAPFAIAAHTHGMQLGIPFVSTYIWRHYFSARGSGLEGWIDHYGEAGNRLYINRGIGFSIVPARVNAVPELTVVTLTPGG
ncbi:MAG TPA: metallophosphoesterase [Gemmatimonadaceae bacterium]|nr:metallophosphoesterase [Gemmatimonadaceae bacterium]